jgi:hypothetical protein
VIARISIDNFRRKRKKARVSCVFSAIVHHKLHAAWHAGRRSNIKSFIINTSGKGEEAASKAGACACACDSPRDVLTFNRGLVHALFRRHAHRDPDRSMRSERRHLRRRAERWSGTGRCRRDKRSTRCRLCTYTHPHPHTQTERETSQRNGEHTSDQLQRSHSLHLPRVRRASSARVV